MFNRGKIGLLLTMVFMVGTVFAVGTPAGEEIKNQATANYIDAAGDAQTTNSNQVITVVKQVYGVSMSPDGTTAAPGQAQEVTPGATVYYPYTLTNTGNGVDSFDLTTTIDTDDTSGITAPVYYFDSNGDGVVQAGEPIITTIDDLAADTSVKFIMAYQIPVDASVNDSVIATPISTSTNDNAQVDDENYHETTVVQDAVLVVSKSVDVSEISPGGSLVYTITATNTGTQDASNVVITDTAPTGTTLSSSATIPAGNNAVNAGVVTGTFATVVPGQVVKLIMTVTVDAGTLPGPINNAATIDYDKNDASSVTLTTNETSTDVQASYAVALGPKDDPDSSNATNPSYSSSGYTVTPSSADDEQVVADVNAGDSVGFINSVVNNGTDEDVFNITLDKSALNLAAGSTVLLTRLDGTPLTDNNGDGIVDSGPLAKDEEFDFIVKVTVAQTQADDSDGASTEHSVVVTATSASNAAQTDSTTNTITDITGAGVAFGNNTGLVDNDGVVDGSSAVDVAADPESTAVFPMDVVNNGGSDDSFNLSGTVDFTDTDGGTVTVAVVYYPASADTNNDGVLSDAEIAAATPVANTGTIPAGEEITVFAVVDVPENVIPQTSTVTQTVTSPLSGATGSFNLDTVTVNAVNALTFTPDRNGTVTSPGTVIYQHVLTNNGNVTVTDIDLTEAASGATTGWTYLYSYDGATYYAATNFPAPATPIAPAATQTIFVQVNAPAAVVQGATNVLEVTADLTFSAGAGTAALTVTDTTTVVSGDIIIEKEWSIDGGTSWYKGDATDATTPPEVAPGEQITYRMTVTNIGTAAVNSIELYDSIPVYTNFVIASQSGGDTITCSSNGGVSYAACPTGSGTSTTITTIKFDITTLAAGAFEQLEFVVVVE